MVIMLFLSNHINVVTCVYTIKANMSSLL